MNPEHVRLVQDSWKVVEPNSAALAEAFYARLFEISPPARALFGATDMVAQKGKFTAMLAAIVAALDDADRLVAEVSAMGRRHVSYGVKDPHYAPVGDALHFALEQVLGAELTTETRAAWREAYLLLAGLMRRGARVSQA